MIRLTRQQVREVDRRAIEDYAIPGIVLMENAARAATEIALEMLGEKQRVLILCGGGNNGGDGLAIARHLHNHHRVVQIALTVDPATYRGDAEVNWTIVRHMNLPVIAAAPDVTRTSDFDLIIDAIFGTGLASPPRDPFPQLADAVNEKRTPILAIDLPSGLDCDTGQPLGACIRATRTITFAAEKAGFANPASRAYTGPIHVGDIGCPRELVTSHASGEV